MGNEGNIGLNETDCGPGWGMGWSIAILPFLVT